MWQLLSYFRFLFKLGQSVEIWFGEGFDWPPNYWVWTFYPQQTHLYTPNGIEWPIMRQDRSAGATCAQGWEKYQKRGKQSVSVIPYSNVVPGVSHINKYDWLLQNMTWLATWSRLGKAKWLTATCREYDWRRRLCIVKARLQYYVHAINCNKSSQNVRLFVLLALLTVFIYSYVCNVL
jgi:hypothetical protein